jgi:osmotically-inducible protein OsmY
MISALFRLILLVVGAFAVAGVLFGWWGNAPILHVEGLTKGTAGAPSSQQEAVAKAREVGAAVGEKTAQAAQEAGRLVSGGSVTAKIKAKIALDDTVKAADVDVDTTGTTVTLTGTVATPAQKERILQLARETAGVTEVVDRIRVAR